MAFRAHIITITAIIFSAFASGASSVPAADADSLTFNSLESHFDAEADSLLGIDPGLESDSAAFAALPWYKQLWNNGFRIHDKNVNYPAFPRFLLKVYDWGDRTFNSYDTDYVVGTGKNWKLLVNNYNWMESYMMLFSMRSRDMLHIRSEIYNDLGFHHFIYGGRYRLYSEGQ